ncbi:MAG: Fe-S cluster assembly protein SufD [Gemmatimonadetes bacterium]|nr:Fe-S cluster assembly protein SufD [Gemmatimonadota bacterium]
MAEATLTAAEPTGAAFTRDALEQLAAGEASWLRARRAEAWNTFEDLPLPSTRMEEWRYTDVRLLGLDAVTLAEPRPGAQLPPAALQRFDGKEYAGRALQLGPAILLVELDDELRRQGVILADLRQAARDHEALVEPNLATRALPATAGKFAALNAALWQAGVFLYVPRGVRIDKPIRILRWMDEPGIAVLPRTLVVAEDGSRVAVVEEFASPDFDRPTLSLGAVELYAGSAAQLHYVALQAWGRGVRHVATQRTIAGRDAALDTLVVNLGASVARVDHAAALVGPGARSDMLGLYFANGDQHFDMNTRQDHTVPHASSDLLYKGALYDKARTVFRGIIKVFPKAQRTDAYQTNRNLLLSERAEATSLPNLEIEADDVRCSHASTVGHLDEDELFYIMSRGVPRAEAERLVVFGFFGEVLDRLPLPAVVDELRAAIERKIR